MPRSSPRVERRQHCHEPHQVPADYAKQYEVAAKLSGAGTPPSGTSAALASTGRQTNDRPGATPKSLCGYDRTFLQQLPQIVYAWSIGAPCRPANTAFVRLITPNNSGDSTNASATGMKRPDSS